MRQASYDFAAIETRWRRTWEEDGTYRTPGPSTRPKRYVLDFFPYPSGEGLSVGHARNYVPTDVLARYFRMRGFSVLHPMGWDAFGLPAENEALLRGRHPRATTEEYAATYRRQLRLLGCSYDWSRELLTSDPEFYRWTQWGFLLLYRRGLAYRASGEQWWCPQCRTILANEQVVDGRCWRHPAVPVERRTLLQWYIRTTAYAGRLLRDLDGLDWPAHIVAMQRNWIGAEGRIRMHDWLVSRQRFWGAPIPIVYCPRCSTVPVPEADLPVRLPDVQRYEPSGTGRSPLAAIPEFVHTTCPLCRGPAERETDTLDGFADSNWYFLRFVDPAYRQGPWNPEAARYWLPVDWYIGGAEQAVMHLLYARFFTKVLYDEGLVSFPEPFPHLRSQGSMLSPRDGARMSKSRGNIVTPDEVVAAHGADALRVAVMFIGPFEHDVLWDPTALRGASRFTQRLSALFRRAAEARGGRPRRPPGDETEFRRRVDQVNRDAGAMIEAFRFNVLIAALMTALADLERREAGWRGTAVWREAILAFVRVVAPVVPFLAEEAWAALGQGGSVHQAPWPEVRAQTQPAECTVVVQVDGRRRGRLAAAPGLERSVLVERARSLPAVAAAIGGRTVADVVVVPERVVNFVIRR